MQAFSKATKECFNCHTPLGPASNFCPHCGQKVQPKKIPLKSVFEDLLSTLFNLESAWWLSLRHLFIPGRITNNYLDGKRKRYVAPIRLFIVSVLVHCTLIGLLYIDYDKIKGITVIENDVPDVEATYYDSLRFNLNVWQNEKLDTLVVAQKDMLEMPKDSLFQKYEIEGFAEQLFIGQLIKSIQNPVAI